MSRIACFGIGLIFSGGLSFSILENIRDRRCLYVKDKNKENYSYEHLFITFITYPW